MVHQHLLKNRCSLSLSICNTVMRMLCHKKKVSQAVNLWLSHVSQRSNSEKEAETIKATRNHFDQENLEEPVKQLIEMDRECGSVSCSPYSFWLIGFCQAWQSDEALKIFNILTEFDIEVTPPSCVLLVHSLCWEGELAAALGVMLYALGKCFSLGQQVGNCLLKKLCMDDKEAHELVWRMSLAGYDMDAYLQVSTKYMLYNQDCRKLNVSFVQISEWLVQVWSWSYKAGFVVRECPFLWQLNVIICLISSFCGFAKPLHGPCNIILQRNRHWSEL